MGILDELHTLKRQFPRSLELAVTQDMADRYEMHCVSVLMYVPGYTPRFHHAPKLPLPYGGTAKILPMCFQNARLVLVEGTSAAHHYRRLPRM